MHEEENIAHNKSHYDQQYKEVNIDSLLEVLNRYESYLDGASKTDISWAGIYHGNLKNRIKGKKVIELGCGDCMNVAIMGASGAKVLANDISNRSGEIVNQLNQQYSFSYPLEFIKGDFTTSDLEHDSVDFVIGKAFLHHLTQEHEEQILAKVAKVLKEDGEARFFEPAINSKILDELRWAMPMNNRPSKVFQPKKFKQWEKEDPHPHRDNSSEHFKKVGKKYFYNVEIIPLGVLERFHRILPRTKDKNGKFKRKALKIEKSLPRTVQHFGARSQIVIYKNPKK